MVNSILEQSGFHGSARMHFCSDKPVSFSFTGISALHAAMAAAINSSIVWGAYLYCSDCIARKKPSSNMLKSGELDVWLTISMFHQCFSPSAFASAEPGLTWTGESSWIIRTCTFFFNHFWRMAGYTFPNKICLYTSPFVLRFLVSMVPVGLLFQKHSSGSFGSSLAKYNVVHALYK